MLVVFMDYLTFLSVTGLVFQKRFCVIWLYYYFNEKLFYI